MSSIFTIKNLSIKAELREGFSNIVTDINFSLNKGEVLAILGESGAGKTMVSLATTKLLPDNCTAYGEILLNGRNIFSLKEKEFDSIRGKEIVLMPQGADFLNQTLTVKSQLFESININQKLSKKDTLKKAIELLTLVGFENPKEILKFYPFQLSGGMAQRVILALGMCAKPKLVIADEPTRGIEEKWAEDIISLFKSCFKESGVVIITHDFNLVAKCSAALVILDGMVIEKGSGEKIFNSPKHPYTKALKNAAVYEDFSLVPKYSCKRVQKENSYPFYGRCKKPLDICQEKTPSLIEKDGVEVRCFNG